MWGSVTQLKKIINFKGDVVDFLEKIKNLGRGHKSPSHIHWPPMSRSSHTGVHSTGICTIANTEHSNAFYKLLYFKDICIKAIHPN